VSGSFGDLPKFPGEEAAQRERLLEELHTPPEAPESFGERMRHAFPAIVMLVGVGIGLFVVTGLVIVLALRGLERGWLVPVLMIAVFLALPAVAIGAALYQRAKRRM
jgi:hypothetical protein